MSGPRRILDPDRPKVPDVLPLVRAYAAKPENSCGGSLHIVLEEHNVDTASVVFCRGWAEDHGDADGVALADLLMLMSPTQRGKLANLFHRPG